MGYSTFLPIVRGGGSSSSFTPSPEEVEFATYLVSSVQLRKELFPDERLFRAARYKVEDMVARDYWGHIDPDGMGANNMVLQFGFPLPPWYKQGKDYWGANTIESLSGGHPTAAHSWAALLASNKGHGRHMLGKGSFARQNRYGIGFSETRALWCILISEVRR